MSGKPTLLAQLIAEFLGTFVLILFGTGVVAMVVLFPTSNAGDIVHGGYTNITLGWGLAVTMGIYVAGRISGAHLIPQSPWPCGVSRISLAQSAALFHRPDCGSVPRRGGCLSQLSSRLPSGRSHAGEDRRSLYYLSGFRWHAAGGFA